GSARVTAPLGSYSARKLAGGSRRSSRSERKANRSPCRQQLIRARAYGRAKRARAASTNRRLDASRLKNQIPGLPSSVTYVLTFSSSDDESTGSGATPCGRSPLRRNGVTPSHAS